MAPYGGPIEPKIALGGYPAPDEGIIRFLIIVSTDLMLIIVKNR